MLHAKTGAFKSTLEHIKRGLALLCPKDGCDSSFLECFSKIADNETINKYKDYLARLIEKKDGKFKPGSTIERIRCENRGTEQRLLASHDSGTKAITFLRPISSLGGPNAKDSDRAFMVASVLSHEITHAAGLEEGEKLVEAIEGCCNSICYHENNFQYCTSSTVNEYCCVNKDASCQEVEGYNFFRRYFKIFSRSLGGFEWFFREVEGILDSSLARKLAVHYFRNLHNVLYDDGPVEALVNNCEKNPEFKVDYTDPKTGKKEKLTCTSINSILKNFTDEYWKNICPNSIAGSYLDMGEKEKVCKNIRADVDQIKKLTIGEDCVPAKSTRNNIKKHIQSFAEKIYQLLISKAFAEDMSKTNKAKKAEIKSKELEITLTAKELEDAKKIAKKVHAKKDRKGET